MKLRHYLIIFSFIWLSLNSYCFAINDTNASTIEALPNKELLRFANALLQIKSYYVEAVDDTKLFDNAIRGMVTGLDPHSGYLDAQDFKDLQDTANGEFNGLGMEVMQDEEFIRIISPIDDTPAQKAGIKSGDLIVKIDGSMVKGMTLREAVSKMRGRTGTTVTLGILRKGYDHLLNIRVKREAIHIQSVKARLLAKNYGYIRISILQADTASNLETAIKKLKIQNGAPLKGLILDLRNNPGGLLQSAVDVTNNFLDSAKLENDHLIVYTKGRLTNVQFAARATGTDVLTGAPMVVLINGSSASGAEIIAGALQDYNRAVIMGTRSFGKGSVQTVLPLDENTALKLTTALYYTPAGRLIQAKGIEPDVVVTEQAISNSPSNKLPHSSTDSFKEADLLGHLSGVADSNKTNTDDDNDDNDDAVAELPTANVSADDFQVMQALNLLEGLVASKH